MFVEIQSAYLILRSWKQNPAATRRELGLWAHWKEDREENDRPLSGEEVERMKAFLRRYAPTSFFRLFPKEEPQG
jgi:hypothetical protein